MTIVCLKTYRYLLLKELERGMILARFAHLRQNNTTKCRYSNNYCQRLYGKQKIKRIKHFHSPVLSTGPTAKQEKRIGTNLADFTQIWWKTFFIIFPVGKFPAVC